MSRVEARENSHSAPVALERGVVRLPTFIAERRRAFGRVAPLTAIDRFWPAAYRSLQWMDSFARRDCRIVAQLVAIDQIFMVRESAAAVRPLHVSVLDEMRHTPVRQMLCNSLDKSHDAIVVPGNPRPR